jgi:hypothetical protein
LKPTLARLVCFVSLLSSPALANGPAPTEHAPASCDNARLMKTLSVHVGGTSLAVHSAKGVVSVADRATGETLLRVTCDEVLVPAAATVERPTRGAARTRTIGPATVSMTARGAISLDIEAGALHREPMSLTLLDDQSVTLTRGDAVLYALATRTDGTVVETEGKGFGCGCVKTTGPEGRTSTRPL